MMGIKIPDTYRLESNSNLHIVHTLQPSTTEPQPATSNTTSETYMQ